MQTKYRKMYLLVRQTITKVLFLSCISGTLGQQLNYTQIFEKRLLSQLNPNSGKIDTIEQPWRAVKFQSSFTPSATVLQDLSAYLPEDDYDLKDGLASDREFSDFQRDDRNLLPEYRSLCQTKTKKVQLSDSQYEYQPPHYHEVFCKAYSLIERVQALARPSQQMCAHPSFHCVQRSKTLFTVRRRWESDCWESHTMQVASGCECMWPVSTLGDITEHY
ncbi:uncharacterized protein LOC124302786 [Neodiprion virginianus]|uniref:uncharacterized protein LOC124302786 n=1 Tax=Neodiprion virginianus TaxID=2961670 RepID=UPI001EE74A21|nr:uncharacterized protein LOC124302786 [Neodiprion virginianus]